MNNKTPSALLLPCTAPKAPSIYIYIYVCVPSEQSHPDHTADSWTVCAVFVLCSHTRWRRLVCPSALVKATHAMLAPLSLLYVCFHLFIPRARGPRKKLRGFIVEILKWGRERERGEVSLQELYECISRALRFNDYRETKRFKCIYRVGVREYFDLLLTIWVYHGLIAIIIIFLR